MDVAFSSLLFLKLCFPMFFFFFFFLGGGGGGGSRIDVVCDCYFF